MPKLTGLFDSFDNLDQVSLENVSSWLKVAPQISFMENYLANRILYPQTVAMSKNEQDLELAILREVLRLNGPKTKDEKSNSFLGNNPFLNIILRKILIPSKFLHFIPDLTLLTWAFVDAFLLDHQREDWFEDLWTVEVTDDVDEIVGSIILPQFSDKSGIMELKLEGKDYKILPGSLTVLPCRPSRCEIAYKFNQGKILGKQESALQIYGGKLGLMIDGRSSK